MFLFRRIEAYKKENRRAISLQGIDSCPISLSEYQMTELFSFQGS